MTEPIVIEGVTYVPVEVDGTVWRKLSGRPTMLSEWRMDGGPYSPMAWATVDEDVFGDPSQSDRVKDAVMDVVGRLHSIHVRIYLAFRDRWIP